MATLTISTNTSWSALEDTSITSATTDLAAKVLTVSAGKAWPASAPLQMTAVGTKLHTSLCCAAITSYSGTTLTMTPTGYTTLGAGSGAGFITTMWGEFSKQAASSTSMTIAASGTKVFQTRPDLTLTTGDLIRCVNRATPATNMSATVVSYNSATGWCTCTATASSGSGTITDWIIVSGGSIANWVIHPCHGDVVDVIGSATLTIDKTMTGLPTRIQALTNGTIYMFNSSTSDPVIGRLCERPASTGFGRIITAQNGKFLARGNFIQLFVGTGTAANWTFPATWDALSAPTYVEVETGASTGVYERWMVSGSKFRGQSRYGYLYGTDFARVPTSLFVNNFGGGTGAASGTIVGGTLYGGIISTVGAITTGTGGTTGFYTNVPLTVSSGTVGVGATANIVVSGGGVVGFQLVKFGSGYTATSVLTATTGNIGNTTGFTIPVSAVVAAGVISDVPLTGGTGTGAIAHITIAAGIVTAVEIVNTGSGYTVGDILSAATTNLGAGSAFTYTLTNLGVPSGGTYRVSGGTGTNGVVVISATSNSGIARFGAITGGSGYVNGTYVNVPFKTTSSSSGGGRGTITVSGGAVTSVTLTDGGSTYVVANTITVDNTFLGGAGSGFSTTVSTVSQGVSGAYFSGFDGAPTGYAVGDIITLESATFGGSIQPSFYVAEVGHYSATTPLTNILTAVVSAAATSTNPYAPYKVYNCTGGTGTGAKYVHLNATNVTSAAGTESGFFIAGTGYAVNDILTVGDYGLQIKVTEIKNALDTHAFQKVAIFDPSNRTLYFGSEPNALAVPNGAKVRIPNIAFDGLPQEAPIINSILGGDSIAVTFESAAATQGISANTGFFQIDSESMTLNPKTGASFAMNRGQRGTRKSTHAAGAICTCCPNGRQTSNQRSQFITLNTQTGGAIDTDTMMFGLWFMPTSGYTRSLSMVRTGWSGAMIAANSTGPVILDQFNQANHPFSGAADAAGSFNAIQNSLSITNGNIHTINYQDANTASPLTISNCPSVTGCNNLNIGVYESWRGDGRPVTFANSFFSNDSTAIPQNLTLLGGPLYMTSMASFRAKNLVFVGCTNRAVNCKSVGVFNFAATSVNPLTFVSTSNTIIHNVSFVGQPPSGNLISADAGCANILVHTVSGSGSWGGKSLLNGIISNSGLVCKVANATVSNLRSLFTAFSNNTQTSDILQNVRLSTTLSSNVGTQTLSDVNINASSTTGVGHGSSDTVDFITGYAPYWATGGGMTPNLPDATWVMNLVDAGTTPTTGRISIGCGGPNSNRNQYIITGSANTYQDNGGRMFVGGANDIVEITNAFALRGITGFQNVDPVSNFGRTGTVLQNFYTVTLGSGGSGYGSGASLLTGGSGYGGVVTSISQAGGIVTGGVFSSGIGYQVGDVVTLAGGGGNATFNITAVKTFSFRMCPWGSNITAVAYRNLTNANLQSAFGAMTGYSSDKGLRIQIKITADGNTHDTTSYLNWINLYTTVNSAFSPPIGYTSLNLTGLQSGSRVAAYSGSTLQDGKFSTTSTSLSLPYTFDGSTATSAVKVRSYSYLPADYIQSYGKDTLSTSIVQTIDPWISVTNPATVAAYTALDTTAKCYDGENYWLSLESQDLKNKYSIRSSSGNNYGVYNLIIDPFAASNFSESGGSITIKASAINTGAVMSLTTTGTVTFLNGATAGTSPLFGSNGKSGVLTLTAPASASVAIYDTTGTRVLYQASTSGVETYVIPFGALTGSFTYKVVKYGFADMTGAIAISTGGFLSVDVSLSADVGITEADVATVAAYTNINTLDQAYDYAVYYETTSTGINYTRAFVKTGAALDSGGRGRTSNIAAAAPIVYTGGVITVKPITTLSAGTTYTSETGTGVFSGPSTTPILLTGAARWDTTSPLTASAGSAASGTKVCVTSATASSIFDARGFTFAAGSTFENTSGQAITLRLLPDQTVPTILQTSGAITVDATVTLTGTFNNFTVGSRIQIYNVTTGTELYNAVPASSTLTYTYIEGTTITTGNSIRVRKAYVSGTTTQLPEQYTTTATALGWSLSDDNAPDTVYNSLGINGLGVSGFAADYINNEVNVTVTTDWYMADLYAWWAYNLTTSQGIAQFFGGITAIDLANFRINNPIVNIYLDNTTSTNLKQLDNRRIYRTDGAYPVKSSGGGGIDVVWRNTILIAETGTSGLLPAEAATLAKIDALTENVSGLRFTVKALEAAPSGGGGSSLTAQQIRDALKLAPTAGTPAVGSIDAIMDALPTISEIEGSTVLAKESTSQTINNTVTGITGLVA